MQKLFKKCTRSVFHKEELLANTEKVNTYEDVMRAYQQWQYANFIFQEAVEVEEIDYAIFMLEAAEKKYEIQLKKAKRMMLNRLYL